MLTSPADDEPNHVARLLSFSVMFLVLLGGGVFGLGSVATGTSRIATVSNSVLVPMTKGKKSSSKPESEKVRLLRSRLAERALNDPAGISGFAGIEAVVRFDADAVLLNQLRQDQPDLENRVKEKLGKVPGLRVRRSWKNLTTAVVALHSTNELDDLVGLAGAHVLGEPEVFVVAASNLDLVGSMPANVSGADGAGTVIAIVDTGVDYTRPTFGSCVSIGTLGAVGPFSGGNCSVVRSVDTGADDGQMDASNQSHGTHVSAVALGVAPKASLAVYDVFAGLSASTISINTAIDDMITQKRNGMNIVVANFSLGVPVKLIENCETTQDLDALLNEGILPVVSAGNSFPGSGPGTFAPACHPGAVGVGGVYDSVGSSLFCDPQSRPDQVLCQSNFGTNVDLLAPGFQVNGGGTILSGTSSSAPHVAGAIADLRAAGAFTSAEAYRLLAKSGVAVLDPRDGQRIPRLQIDAALALLRSTGEVGDSNDLPSAPVELVGRAGTATSSNFGAIAEDGGAADPNHRVWFRFIPPSSGTLSLSTRYSNFDTFLTVTTDGTTSVDDDSGVGRTSELQVQVSNGLAVSISVSGVNAMVGRIHLVWNFVTPIRSPFVASVPTRLLDTRRSGYKVVANETRQLQLPQGDAGMPGLGDLAQLSIVGTSATGQGFLAAFVCGSSTPTSQLNWDAQVDSSNVVYVPVGAQGQVCVSVSADTHLVVDYYGRYLAASLAPASSTRRLLDSRLDPSQRLVPGNLDRSFFLASVSDSQVRLVNVTVTNPTADAVVAISQCGNSATQIVRRVPIGSSRATSMALLGLQTPSICVLSSVPTDVIIDEVAEIVDRGSLRSSFKRYVQTEPNTGLSDISVTSGSVGVVAVSTPTTIGDRVALVRVTVDASSSPAGWVSVRSCSHSAGGSSFVNFSAGEVHGAVLALPVGPLCVISSTNLTMGVGQLGIFESEAN